MALKRESPNLIHYEIFNHHEETQNGADWEWCILVGAPSKEQGYLFRVQAKKATSNKSLWGNIAYISEGEKKKEKNGEEGHRQIDLLIEKAKAKNAIPLYVFYSDESKGKTQSVFDIPSSIFTLCNCPNGVYIADAYKMKDILEQPNKEDNSKFLSNAFGMSFCDHLLFWLNQHYLADCDRPFYTLYDECPCYLWKMLDEFHRKYNLSLDKLRAREYLRSYIENRKLPSSDEEKFSTELAGVAVFDFRKNTVE